MARGICRVDRPRTPIPVPSAFTCGGPFQISATPHGPAPMIHNRSAPWSIPRKPPPSHHRHPFFYSLPRLVSKKIKISSPRNSLLALLVSCARIFFLTSESERHNTPFLHILKLLTQNAGPRAHLRRHPGMRDARDRRLTRFCLNRARDGHPRPGAWPLPSNPTENSKHHSPACKSIPPKKIAI